MAAIIGNAVPPQRQRVIDAMHLREPDRVPVGLWGTSEGYQNLRKGLGMGYNADPLNYRTGSTTWTTDVAFELDIREARPRFRPYLHRPLRWLAGLPRDSLRGGALRHGHRQV